MIQTIIGAIIFFGLFAYALLYGAAKNRNPEYQAWRDDEQVETLRAMRDK